MSQVISTDVKQKVSAAIRDDGKRVVDAASEFGVSTKAIYRWLRDGVGGDSRALEIARLKRELEAVYGILGKVTVELKHTKK